MGSRSLKTRESVAPEDQPIGPVILGLGEALARLCAARWGKGFCTPCFSLCFVEVIKLLRDGDQRSHPAPPGGRSNYPGAVEDQPPALPLSAEPDNPGMRKGLAALAAQAEPVQQQDPFVGQLFVFRGLRGDLVKVIW